MAIFYSYYMLIMSIFILIIILLIDILLINKTKSKSKILQERQKTWKRIKLNWKYISECILAILEMLENFITKVDRLTYFRKTHSIY